MLDLTEMFGVYGSNRRLGRALGFTSSDESWEFESEERVNSGFSIEIDEDDEFEYV